MRDFLTVCLWIYALPLFLKLHLLTITFFQTLIPIYLYEIAHGSAKESHEAALFYLYIFILFRYFDIKKPFPISFFDKKFKNSFGVIMDDVIAGLYVVLTLIIFMVIKSKFF